MNDLIRPPAALLLALAPAAVAGCGGVGPGHGPAGRGGPAGATVYRVYVAAESEDLLHRVLFDGTTATVERTVGVGEMPGENEGPHGLTVSPDGRFLYLTTGHGVPDGKLWKYEAGPDTLVAEPVLLGRFPATLDLTPDGRYAFVANFNLHGELEPSSVSVVYTPDMVEMEQIPTCTQPHGARFGAGGLFLYSACVYDDQVVEIDSRTFRVSRRFSVDPAYLTPLEPGESDVATAAAPGPDCGPTWAFEDPTRARLYVACNAADRILVLDTDRWRLAATFEAGRGPYNMAMTPDGRLLVVTLKQGDGVEFFEAETGRSLARGWSSSTITHGVVVSPDGRYAFTTVEGVGADPGKVDVWDLASFRRVGDVEVGQQVGGIAFWTMEGAGGR